MRRDEVTELFRRAGWTLVGEKNHYKWRCPHGCCQMTTSKTNNDRSRWRNVLRDMKHCQGAPAR